MLEIRIEKVYDGHIGHTTYINLKQVKSGVVEYTEDFYPSRNSMPIKGDPVLITSQKANAIFLELRQTADPYIRHSAEGLFEKMR